VPHTSVAGDPKAIRLCIDNNSRIRQPRHSIVKTTGPEIWNDNYGHWELWWRHRNGWKPYRYFALVKLEKAQVMSIGVEPVEKVSHPASSRQTNGRPAQPRFQALGAGYPRKMDMKMVIASSSHDEEYIVMARRWLAKKDFLGHSCGAAVPPPSA